MKKEITKFFGLGDYLEEENFLQKQHRAGWKMVGSKKAGLTYVFEKCTPEEYSYQLDFKENGQAEDDYLQLFEDCGWEFFHKLNNWYYFRKKKTAYENENTIFNDAASRAEMAKKVVRYQAAVIVPTVVVFPALLNEFVRRSENAIWLVFYLVYALIAIFVIGLGIRNYWKLNKIIEQNKPV